MCQAFAAEQQLFSALGGSVTESGFIAAYRGEPRSTDRFVFKDEWLHGYNCFGSRIIPHRITDRVREVLGIPRTQELEEEFRRTGELPEEVVEIICPTG